MLIDQKYFNKEIYWVYILPFVGEGDVGEGVVLVVGLFVLGLSVVVEVEGVSGVVAAPEI